MSYLIGEAIMHPILFSIGKINFTSFGFMVSLGFLFGILLAQKISSKVKISPEKTLDISLLVIVSSIIGARVAYVVFYWNELQSPFDALKIWNGGLVFYGGLLFGVISIMVGSRMLKINLLDMLDVAAPATMLGYAVGRIGCFLNGCCYGRVCDLLWSVKFPLIDGLRHPTQLYSSIFGLAAMIVLIYIFYNKKFQGQVIASGLIFYSIYRFLIEYLRTNPHVVFNLTEAQIASILLFVFSIVLYGIFSKRKRS